MPIPFPGMNPYLEHPDLWPTLHRKLIKSIASRLNHQLAPIYQVRICERRYQVSGEDSLVVGSPGLSWRGDNRVQNHDLNSLSHADAPVSVHTAPLTSIPDTDARNLENVAAATEQIQKKGPIAVFVPVPQKIYEPT